MLLPACCQPYARCVFNLWKPFERNLSFEPFAMKNGKLLALLVGVMLVLAGTVYTVKHLKDQEQQAEATYGTETPRVADIVLKTLASGSVQPRQEILIKPQVSSIIRRVLVEAGDVVEAGDLLAEVMIVRNVAALSNAESRLARRDHLGRRTRRTTTATQTFWKGVWWRPPSAAKTEIALKQAREELYSAEDNLRIVQASPGAGQRRHDGQSDRVEHGARGARSRKRHRGQQLREDHHRIRGGHGGLTWSRARLTEAEWKSCTRACRFD